MTTPRKILVLDANAFIRCLNLQSLHEEYEIYTTPEVLYEIKDKRAREKFQTLTFDIRTEYADDKAVNFGE